MQHKQRLIEYPPAGANTTPGSVNALVDWDYHFKNISLNPDTNLFDAFARFRVSNIFTVYDIKQNTSNQPLFYDDAEVSGSGTSSVYNPYKASSTISVSANTAGVRARQTKTWAQYQPGKSQMILTSFNFRGAVSGVYKRAGMFTDTHGLFFEVRGSGVYVVKRTYNTGAAVDIAVPQSEWNADKLDGTGDSGLTLDLNLVQLGYIDYEWLGVGRVRFGFVIDGKVIYCHYFSHSNYITETYMSNPNAPIRFEIENDGTGAAASMDMLCVSVQSEGGQEEHSISTYVSRDGTPVTLANQDLYTPVLSLRLKSTRPCTRIDVDNLSLLATTSVNYEWALFINPTIAGTDLASWQAVTNSAMEYDIARNATNTLTGGYRVDGGYGASTALSKAPVGIRVPSFLTIGTNIDGSRDEYVIGVKNIDANGGTMYGGCTVGEYC